MPESKILIIGGGPAGCAAAYTLDKKGHDVTLIEASDTVGGRTRQLQIEEFSVGVGALFLMGGIYPRTSALLKETGHWDELQEWAGKTEIMDNDNARYNVSFVDLLSYLKI